MVYFPKNTNKKNKKPPTRSPENIFAMLLQQPAKKQKNTYIYHKKKTLHYVGASMYWEHNSKAVTRWNLE